MANQLRMRWLTEDEGKQSPHLHLMLSSLLRALPYLSGRPFLLSPRSTVWFMRNLYSNYLLTCCYLWWDLHNDDDDELRWQGPGQELWDMVGHDRSKLEVDKWICIIAGRAHDAAHLLCVIKSNGTELCSRARVHGRCIPSNRLVGCLVVSELHPDPTGRNYHAIYLPSYSNLLVGWLVRDG